MSKATIPGPPYVELSENTNCLEGLKCPECGNDERLVIHGTSAFEVYDDGTNRHWDVEWDDRSHAVCPNHDCNFEGQLGEFRTPPIKRPALVLTKDEALHLMKAHVTPWAVVDRLARRFGITLCTYCRSDGDLQVAAATREEPAGERSEDGFPVSQVRLCGGCAEFFDEIE